MTDYFPNAPFVVPHLCGPTPLSPQCLHSAFLRFRAPHSEFRNQQAPRRLAMPRWQHFPSSSCSSSSSISTPHSALRTPHLAGSALRIPQSAGSAPRAFLSTLNHQLSTRFPHSALRTMPRRSPLRGAKAGPPDNSSQFVEAMLQLNRGELFLQIRQSARPIEFKPAFGGSWGFGSIALRQKLHESLHLGLRGSRQRLVLCYQSFFAHTGFNLPTSGPCRNPTNRAFPRRRRSPSRPRIPFDVLRFGSVRSPAFMRSVASPFQLPGACNRRSITHNSRQEKLDVKPFVLKEKAVSIGLLKIKMGLFRLRGSPVRKCARVAVWSQARSPADKFALTRRF